MGGGGFFFSFLGLKMTVWLIPSSRLGGERGCDVVLGVRVVEHVTRCLTGWHSFLACWTWGIHVVRYEEGGWIRHLISRNNRNSL